MTRLVEERQISVSRACELIGLPRSSYYYEPTQRTPAPVDEEVRAAVVEIATERVSFGYRRVKAMTCRKLGRRINEKKIRRIMRIENLTLDPCVQPPRVRVKKHSGKQITSAPDIAYQMDMKWVWCGQDGWAYLQNIVECCTSEWLGYTLDKFCGAREAIRVLDDVAQRRFPMAYIAPGTTLRVDNGPCYRADKFIEHATRLGFAVEHIQVRTPEDNGCVESLHAGLDRDYLKNLVFDSLAEARAYLAWAWNDYNTIKPMKRLGWKTPTEYRQEVTASAN